MARLGTTNQQLRELGYKSGIYKGGESRAEAKAEAREVLESMGEAIQSEKVNALVGIYSVETMQAYFRTWTDFAMYAKAKDEFKVKNITELTAEHAESFLSVRIEKGISLDAWKREAAALSKMETALQWQAENNSIERKLDLRPGIDEVRSLAREELQANRETRAYIDPKALVENIDDERHRLAAQIQLEAGARIHEVAQIRESQLRGIKENESGERFGVVHLDRGDTKGGRERELKMPEEAYRRLEAEIRCRGTTIDSKRDCGEVQAFKIDKSEYRESLKFAAENSGQNYTGSHGLRHNFAKNKMEQHQNQGWSRDASLRLTAEDMGHSRGRITETYLR